MPLECCICTDVLVSTQIKVSSTPCGHVYHTPCIFDWINKCENGVNCPVCRRIFQSSEVVPLDVVTDDDITAIAKAISEQVTLNNADEINPFSEPATPLRSFRPILSDYNNIDSSDEYYDEQSIDGGEVSDAQPVELSIDEGNNEYYEDQLSEGNVSDAQDLELSIDEGSHEYYEEQLSEGNVSDAQYLELSIDEGSHEYYEEQLSVGNVSDAQDVELSFEDCDQSEHLDIDNDDLTSADIENNDFAEVDDDIYDQNDADNYSNDDFDDNYSNNSYGGNDDFDDYD